jgi:hypothetical protein
MEPELRTICGAHQNGFLHLCDIVYFHPILLQNLLWIDTIAKPIHFKVYPIADKLCKYGISNQLNIH